MRNRYVILFVLLVLSTLPSFQAASAAHLTRAPAPQEQNSASKAASVHESLTLSELRRKYAETFKFRGPHVRQIALTFDDVPDPRFTPGVLAVLAKYHVKATFFVVGQRAEKHPELVRRIYREGHLIGNHSYNHPLFKNRELAYFKGQILRTAEIIHNLTGVHPRFIRPPYGEINEQQLKWVKSSGYKVINWNVDSKDWKGLSKEQVKANILSSAGPGSIILQHAGGGDGADLSGTVQALPEIIRTLQSHGYTFVDLSELLHIKGSR
ncbi:polysaccharide deacetylase family protein [Paenibacillus sp. YPG26]|uniref:polysaccharide deacetylase family protein n=1 Tax=Paenibacillus sp. YPG26 TaxID=2878915 RepID=UPI0020419962|nr:polysaccharide deacetylase family protein [Paenibacillus sp. YPG26]USB31577.1 polysaccharide deacetylase family protein [Paenibacillus sp. YPG26]